MNTNWKAFVPNFITISRTIFFWIAIFLVAVNFQKNEAFHLVACLIAGFLYLMDFADGYFARKFDRQGIKGAMSELGGLLDQSSDKIICITMFLFFVTLPIFPPIVKLLLYITVIVIFFRDLLLSSIRLVAKTHNVEFQTSNMGKTRTVYIGFGGALFYAWYYWGENYPTVKIAIWSLLGFFAATIVFLAFFKLHIRNKWAPTRWDQFCLLATNIAAAIYPPYTLLLALTIITLYTLFDYCVKFLSSSVTKTKEDRQSIYESSIFHSTISLALVAISIIAVRFNLLGAIAISSAIFMLQLAWSAAKIPKTQAP